MSVFICGDTHFGYDHYKLNTKRWPKQKELTKQDYLIIAGDFGLLWYHQPDKEEINMMEVLSNRKFTTLFIDGNHENFDRLGKLEEVEMFGGKVGKVTDSIYHLKRGYVYEINGKKFFTFGGAISTDKMYRQLNVSWWPEETHTRAEEEFAYDNLEKHGFCVDFVVTHAAPRFIIPKIYQVDEDRYSDPTSTFLERLAEKVQFRSWHFGHYHRDEVYDDKYHLHYNAEPFQVA